jgi:hypothetical protein
MKRTVLLIVSILLMVGGIVRVFANKGLFKMFAMEHLWVDHPFFIYIYKLLGVFVIWIGILFFICSKDLVQSKPIIKGSIIGLILFFLVSLITGLWTGLELQFFLVDSLFALFLAIFLFFTLKN